MIDIDKYEGKIEKLGNREKFICRVCPGKSCIVVDDGKPNTCVKGEPKWELQ